MCSCRVWFCSSRKKNSSTQWNRNLSTKNKTAPIENWNLYLFDDIKIKSQTKKTHIRRKFCLLYQEEPRTENEMNLFWGSGLYDTMEKKEEIFLRHCDFFEWSELKKSSICEGCKSRQVTWMVYTISFPIVLRLIFPLCSFPLNFSIIKSVVCLFFLKKKICWTHVHFWGHWYPCFELLVMSPLGFKARVGSLIWTLRRHTWYTFPEIHLWCDTSASIYGQHSSQSLSPHACFSRGRMLDLNHRPPAWQVDALTTRPQWPGFIKFKLT